jgi:hypothetical protein
MICLFSLSFAVVARALECWERMKHDGLPLIKRVSGSKYRFFNGQEPRDFRDFHENLPLVRVELQEDGQRVVEERFELPNEMQHEKSPIPCFATGLQLNGEWAVKGSVTSEKKLFSSLVNFL